MPLEFSDHVSPSGMAYLRVDAAGTVDVADGEALVGRIRRPSRHLPKALTVITDGTEYSPKVRKLFSTLEADFSATATVITSPFVRAVVSVMLRLRVRGGVSPFRIFTDEASALAWLEQQPFVERPVASTPDR